MAETLLIPLPPAFPPPRDEDEPPVEPPVGSTLNGVQLKDVAWLLHLAEGEKLVHGELQPSAGEDDVAFILRYLAGLQRATSPDKPFMHHVMNTHGGPCYVELELTESLMADDVYKQCLAPVIRALHAAGARFKDWGCTGSQLLMRFEVYGGATRSSLCVPVRQSSPPRGRGFESNPLLSSSVHRGGAYQGAHMDGNGDTKALVLRFGA